MLVRVLFIRLLGPTGFLWSYGVRFGWPRSSNVFPLQKLTKRGLLISFQYLHFLHMSCRQLYATEYFHTFMICSVVNEFDIVALNFGFL